MSWGIFNGQGKIKDSNFSSLCAIQTDVLCLGYAGREGKKVVIGYMLWINYQIITGFWHLFFPSISDLMRGPIRPRQCFIRCFLCP